MTGGRVVLLLAVAAGVKAAAAHWLLGATLIPDTGLYAQGGVGLYPSPLGRLVGVGGVGALALLNVGANVVAVLAAARIAGRLGGRPWLAAAVLTVSPLGVWSIFTGVDTAAAALIAAGLAWGRGRFPWHWWAAVAFHPAAALIVASYAVAVRPRVGLWVVAAGAVAALLTPYRAMLDVDVWVAVTGALATFGVFLLTTPLLAIAPARSLVLPAAVGGAVAAGLMGAIAWETNCRYLLPSVVVGAGVCGAARLPNMRRALRVA